MSRDTPKWKLMQCTAAIDFSKSNIKVFAPCEWPMLLQTARRSKPYAVKEFDFSDFYDLHELVNSLGTHDLQKRVHWMSVKCIRVKKGACNEIEVKESYSDEYKRVTFCPTRGRNTRRHAEVQPSLTLTLLKPAYTHQLPVSQAKKMDLVKFCNSGLIPKQHHAFYRSLPTSDDLSDRLLEPDRTETDEDAL